jgi:hypothetical protein
MPPLLNIYNIYLFMMYDDADFNLIMIFHLKWKKMKF